MLHGDKEAGISGNAARHARLSRGEVDRHQGLNIVRIAVAYFFGNTLVHMPTKHDIFLLGVCEIPPNIPSYLPTVSITHDQINSH